MDINTGTLAMGFLLGMMLQRLIYKLPQGDIEGVAFTNGYESGYNDGERGRSRKWEPWDGNKWREKYPEGGE